MHQLEDLKWMLCDELEEITRQGKIKSKEALDVVDKLTHSIKSIDTIIAMEDAGYSNDNYAYENRGGYSRNSYARGRGRNARRDSMGRYSSGYSRGNVDEIKAEIMEKLQELDSAN